MSYPVNKLHSHIFFSVPTAVSNDPREGGDEVEIHLIWAGRVAGNVEEKFSLTERFHGICLGKYKHLI